ncbi:MAG: carboxypeptidase regulatory-like domain-containing protein, partial [Archangium sp.]|nr:carboxypeptidase regulatory-like domain-containing protein [Archangium sp.]
VWSRTPVTVPQPRQPLDEPRPIVRESKWAAPIAPRGQRTISGIVTRRGQPAEGVTVTALSAAEVLSRQRCVCDDGCDEPLTSRTCPEFEAQLADWVASRAGEGVPMARTTTDASGAFTLQGLDDSPVTVWADANDGVTFREGLQPGGAASTDGITRDVTSPLELELEIGQVNEGTVKRFDTQTPKGVLLTAVAFDRPRFFEVVLGDDGAFRLGPVPRGDYLVVALQEELLPGVETVDHTRPRKVELELASPRAISGVVLDGDPVAGAKVRLSGMHHKRAVTTGSDGTFTFKRLRPGSFDLYAEAAQNIAHEDVQLGSGADLTGVTLELSRGESFSGRVVDARQSPIAEAQVSVFDGAEWHRVKTGADGRFTFEVLPQGERSFTARKRGYLDASLDSAEREVTLVLGDATHISGRVESAPGVLVKEFNIGAETLDGDDGPDDDFLGASDWFESKDGTFSLDVRPGRFTLRVESDLYATATLEVTAPASDVVVRVKSGARVVGQVLDLDGAPVKDANISVDQPNSKRNTSDGNGRFTIEGLSPGEARVTATPGSDDEPTWVAFAEVTLKEGETVNVTLAPKRGVALAGTVVDAKGTPVANCKVTAMSAGNGEPSVGGALTDAQGRFSIRTIPAGKVNLVATAERQRGTRLVTAPDERVVVTLKRDTTLTGRVVDETGAPIKAFRANMESFDTLDGRFETRAAKGKQEILFEASGYASRTLSVTNVEGPNEVGDVKLASGRTVSGLVLNAVTRAPISGAEVSTRTETSGDSVDTGSTKSDSQGRFKLTRVDPTSVRLVSTHPDYLQSEAPLTPSTSKQDLLMKPGAVVTVRLLDAKGAPYPRGRVFAQQQRKWKDFSPQPDGTQVGRGLSPGKWVLQVRAEKNRIFRPIEISIADAPQSLELREASDGITVRVTCEGATGMALMSGEQTQLTDLQELMDAWDLIEVHDGAAQRVPAGRWTLIAVRSSDVGSKLELSSQVVDVPSSGEFSITHTPKWRPVSGKPLFRSENDPDD